MPPLIDLEPASPDEVEDHREVTEVAFVAANVSAQAGDYEAALRWLDAAKRLALVLPSEYALRGAQWQRAMLPTQMAK